MDCVEWIQIFLVEFATWFFLFCKVHDQCVLTSMDIEDKVICRCQMYNGEQRSFFPTSIQTPILLREHFLAKDFTFHFVSLHFFFITERFCLEDLVWTSCSNRNKEKTILGDYIVQCIGKSTKNWISLNISAIFKIHLLIWSVWDVNV